MLLNELINEAISVSRRLSSGDIPVYINNCIDISSVELSLGNKSYYANITTSNSNKTILDKVANYLRNNLERYDDHIGLTKEEFIEDLIKNVT